VTPGGISIADINAGLQIQFASNMHTQIVASKGLTPLFKARSVKKPIFGPAVFRSAELSLAEITPEEIEYEE
jgi:hypothetical protein